MRTVCPTCQAAYDVPAPVLATGRTLRCARCGADFVPSAAVVPDADAAPLTAPALTVPALTVPVLTASDSLTATVSMPVPASAAPAPVLAQRLVLPEAEREPAPQAGPRLVVMAGWVVSLVVLVALGWGFVAWRGAIQRAWPVSERVYAVLGYR